VAFRFCRIDEGPEIKEQALQLCLESFPRAGMWPDVDEKKARETIEECLEEGNLTLGIMIGPALIAWAGLRPMYDETWELHPMVVGTDFQGRGYGKVLLDELESRARSKGIIGIFAGSDDETFKTSLSEKDLTGENILEEIKNIKNYRNHPYEFYQKCGYSIVGVIPNANGPNKPDIFLWKDIRTKGHD